MKSMIGFPDFFMSRVTGRIILPMFPDVPQNYVWIGNYNDRPIPSPILIDLELELIRIRTRLAETDFIIGHASEGFLNSQVLDRLIPGILTQNAGVVSIAELPYHNIWIGDVTNHPIAQARIWDDGVGNGNLPAYTSAQYKMIWRMNASGIPILSNEMTTIEINIDSILDHLVDIDIHLGDIDIEIGDINIRIDSIVDAMSLPYQNIWIGDIDNIPQPNPRIFVNNLPTMLSTDSSLLLGAYNLYRGSPDPLILGQPEIVKTLHITNMADLTEGKLWIGTNSSDPLNYGPNRPVEIVVLPLDNMANLPHNKIWRGDISDRPVPVDDLTNLEVRVNTTESEITDILSNIASILSSIATIVSSIDSILSAIATITGEITVIDTTLIDLQSQIDSNVASGLDHLADLQLQIDSAIASGNDHLATINTTLSYLQSEIDTINSSITTINTTLTDLQTQIDTINTTLTTIEGDITSINSTITTIEGDITNITDVLIPAVYTYIDDAISNITNNFIAGGVINMNNNRITNLPCDPVEDNDAISFCFLWHILHDEVTISW